MGILCAGATDIGRKRKTNQDSICLDHAHHFFAVADGMGGHNGGDIASQLSVKVMGEYLGKNNSQDPQTMMKNLIQEINRSILKKAEEQPELHGMGTTVSAVQFAGPQLVIGNVGDSRVYMVNNQNIFQLTRDHSFVQEKLNMGIYTREEAVKDPQKNVLVRSVGFEPDVQVDVFNYRVCKNDIFLICSDGLHGKVSDGDILHIVQRNISDPSRCQLSDVEQTVKELIQQANDNGGQDNISVILAVAQA
ncbi:Stp1/IreP family PP2C-type Ser/Thr phosphatase [Peredibacter starrii]|uniref:Stp1/IreP family PP2C-type Ser/Thr phosphatase n=1 Tax=Peredibacter starrii TaxID=28202 RepID=A0AAX4HJF4_9BACT|nr:Stp1/IreP family PP2C-type Ser/Thr phosphatase [Peredibacter starrii]WPU63159.1 Stp1/IreP family PP2C-type Ser/Thr phosphatase [Peredibacter starrii]